MFKIIKSEIAYNLFPILLYFIFCMICFPIIWFVVKYEHNRVPLILLIMLVSTIAIIFFSQGKIIKEKRMILFNRLPVSVLELWLTRYLYVSFIWFSILLLFFISSLISKRISFSEVIIPSALQLIFLNTLIIFILAAYFIYRDFKNIIIFKPSKILLLLIWIILYLTILLPFFIITDFGGLFGQHSFLQENLLFLTESPLDISVMNFIAIILLFLSLFIFKRRKSYFES